MDANAIGVLGAGLLLTGGLALLVVAAQGRRKRGVERLRRVLVEDATDTADPSLGAAWSSMVRAAEQLGSGSGLYATLRERLVRAGWVLRPTEFLLMLGGLLAAGAFLGARLSGVPGSVVLGLVLPLGTWLLLGFQSQRYSQRCDDLLPDALGQMASAMRSGHSMQQALEGVASHGAEPLAGEFGRVLADTKVGRPIDEAMVAMAERVGSTDLRWAVRAILIQRRTGGKLADILDVLAEFMRDRTEVRREVTALTAEGRISAVILMILPFVVLGGVLVTNPGYLTPLVEHPLGRFLSFGAVGSMGIAWFLIRGIVRVEV